MYIQDSIYTEAVMTPQLAPPAHAIHEILLMQSIFSGSQAASQLLLVDIAPLKENSLNL